MSNLSDFYWHFMWIVYQEETICMKFQIQYSRKNEKNIISLPSAEFGHSMEIVVHTVLWDLIFLSFYEGRSWMHQCANWSGRYVFKHSFLIFWWFASQQMKNLYSKRPWQGYYRKDTDLQLATGETQQTIFLNLTVVITTAADDILIFFFFFFVFFRENKAWIVC